MQENKKGLVHLIDELAQTEQKLDHVAHQTEPAQEAARSVTRIWDEIAKLRDEAVNVRTQVEERIGHLRKDEESAYSELETTRNLLAERQQDFNSRIDRVQAAVQRLHGLMKNDKSNLQEMVEELRHQIDQTRLDFGIKESAELLQEVGIGPDGPLTDEEAIEDIGKLISGLEDNS
jgi:chromosome segregation ATPase